MREAREHAPVTDWPTALDGRSLHIGVKIGDKGVAAGDRC
jgi:hypothetical protein